MIARGIDQEDGDRERKTEKGEKGPKDRGEKPQSPAVQSQAARLPRPRGNPG